MKSNLELGVPFVRKWKLHSSWKICKLVKVQPIVWQVPVVIWCGFCLFVWEPLCEIYQAHVLYSKFLWNFVRVCHFASCSCFSSPSCLYVVKVFEKQIQVAASVGINNDRKPLNVAFFNFNMIIEYKQHLLQLSLVQMQHWRCAFWSTRSFKLGWEVNLCCFLYCFIRIVCYMLYADKQYIIWPCFLSFCDWFSESDWISVAVIVSCGL